MTARDEHVRRAATLARFAAAERAGEADLGLTTGPLDLIGLVDADTLDLLGIGPVATGDRAYRLVERTPTAAELLFDAADAHCELCAGLGNLAGNPCPCTGAAGDLAGPA